MDRNKPHETVEAREGEVPDRAEAQTVRYNGRHADSRMLTTEALLRRSIDVDGAGLRLTLDGAFQGLPGTAHGGSVLAAFDAIAGVAGIRQLSGAYLKRVPLGVALRLEVARGDGAAACRLAQGSAVLVEGGVVSSSLPEPRVEIDATDGLPLPVSKTCFVCGVDNRAGLCARLRFDEQAVFGLWIPPGRFRTEEGGLAPLALTAILDEAAFWLGALASGESGMTTDLAVTLASPIFFASPVILRGERAHARPMTADPRYWQTHVAACDAAGRVVAAADITFVAVRGAARKLAAWLAPMNPPDLMPKIFPAYA
jgi:acyl-coenzyme A thioesterase PaaI-like protein